MLAAPPYARLGRLVASPDVMATIPRGTLSRAIRSHAYAGAAEDGHFQTRHGWECVVFFLRTDADREETRIWMAGE
ncbi:hypothetical protein [Tautonia plasticadhaerens]|uniref:Uncharacterized protein n=1 Tax=Tautonia plasticadhaerens TaxID=2527974 RepID=A0A518GUY4_9BACT|nr:hypothetical protein [Tautonia plasticadhaerens]QDV32399.1 hypothetical protein ElP_02310 [Tautonia plasticadhaerens]